MISGRGRDKRKEMIKMKIALQSSLRTKGQKSTLQSFKKTKDLPEIGGNAFKMCSSGDYRGLKSTQERVLGLGDWTYG